MSRLRTVVALTGALLVSAASAFSPLISSSIVGGYRSAVADASHGRTSRAMAILEGYVGQVKVGVNPGTLPVGREDEYLDGIAHAVQTWNDAVSGTPFVLARPGERADLTVSFVPNITRGGDVQGVVEAQRHFAWGGRSHSSELIGTVQIKDRAFGRRLNGDEAGRVMLHELGHVLGLDDDYDGRGAMAAFRSGEGWVEPTNSEVDAVEQFRGEVRRTLASMRTRG